VHAQLFAVRKVELEMATQAKLNHEYLPITGLEEFCAVSRALMFGDELVRTLGVRIAHFVLLARVANR
jgi:aspartate/tyrosine/aromatic aminotransferase